MANSETLVERFAARAALPDARVTRPSTILEENAVTGLARTWIVRTARQPKEGFGVFLQVAGKEEFVQLVLPHQVAQAIYRQRDALMDRSTPESRARKRAASEAAKRRKEREARRQRWAEKNPGRRPGQKNGA